MGTAYTKKASLCTMFDSYIQGFLTTSALLVVEHIVLYARLEPRGDATDRWRVLAKLFLGVAAILVGCAVIAWKEYDERAILAPIAASMGGLVVVAGYIGRWLWGRALGSAYIRGRLAGLADHADIAEDRDGG